MVATHHGGTVVKSLEELNRLLSMMQVAVRQIEHREIHGRHVRDAPPTGCIAMTYVSAGRVVAAVPRRAPRQCATGSLLFVPAGIEASYSADEATMTTIVADVRLSGSSLFDRVSVSIFSDLAPPPMIEEAMNMLRAVEARRFAALGDGALAESLTKICILWLLQDFFSRPGIDHKIISALANDRLAPAIAKVLERPSDRHSSKSMAALAGLSRSTFSRLFQEAMGQTPSGFIVRTRLFHAAEMLRSSKAPIKAIAMGVGFQSRSHFSRAFRQAYGADPTAYRNDVPQERETPVPQDLRAIKRGPATSQ